MTPEPVPDDPPTDTASAALRPSLRAVRDHHTTRPGHGHPEALPAPFSSDQPTTTPEEDDTELLAAEAAAAVEVAKVRAELPARDPAVFDCYLGELALALEPTSEADPVGILASLLAAVSVRVGPGPHVRAGDDRHPLLVWPLLVGRTGIGKKGTAWSAARRLLTAAEPDFTTGNIHSGLTSGEGLAALFTEDDQPAGGPGPGGGDGTKDAAPPRNPPGRTGAPRAVGRLLPAGDNRLLDFEPEWGAVMARMRRDGNSLSATLRAAWEGGNLSTLTVTARVARTSHIGVMAHITPDEFKAKVSSSDLAGGTYNRFLPVFVAATKFLPGSRGAPEELMDRLGAELAGRLEKAEGCGEVGFATDGQRAWRRLYVEFGSAPEDRGPVVEFTARAAPNCLRIAALYATLDGHVEIGAGHLAAAAALVRYSIASARAVFTGGDNSRLLAWITAAGPAGRTRKDITIGFYRGHAKAPAIQAALDALAAAGQITSTVRAPVSGRGRPTELITATTPLDTGEPCELAN